MVGKIYDIPDPVKNESISFEKIISEIDEILVQGFDKIVESLLHGQIED